MKSSLKLKDSREMSEQPKLTSGQIESLARPIQGLTEKILDFYKNPVNERAFQEWYIETFGEKAPEGV